MLENEPARQQRQRRTFDPLRVDRNHRHLEITPDRFEEALFIHLARIEHLARPRSAIQIRRKLRRFVARRHPAREQKIDERIADRWIHKAILRETN